MAKASHVAAPSVGGLIHTQWEGTAELRGRGLGERGGEEPEPAMQFIISIKVLIDSGESKDAEITPSATGASNNRHRKA